MEEETEWSTCIDQWGNKISTQKGGMFDKMFINPDPQPKGLIEVGLQGFDFSEKPPTDIVIATKHTKLRYLKTEPNATTTK